MNTRPKAPVKPTPGLPLQDPKGERWVVMSVNQGLITLMATHDNPRSTQPDPVFILSERYWAGMFRQGWLAL